MNSAAQETVEDGEGASARAKNIKQTAAATPRRFLNILQKLLVC